MPSFRSFFVVCLMGMPAFLSSEFPGQVCLAANPDPVEELRARVELLEEQNRQLQHSLAQQAVYETPPPFVPPALDSQLSEPQPYELPSQPLFVHQADDWTDLGMTATWNNGLEFATRDRAFRVHVGGRTQLDTAWFATDRDVQRDINIPYGSGIDFRRARLRIDGTMYETIEWAAEYDFVNSSRVGNTTNDGYSDFDVTALTDLWWTFTKLPVIGNLRIGNQKEPIGFEHLVSSRFLPFMERSFNQDAFYGGLFNGFTPGVSMYNNYADERGLWHFGVYKPTDNVFAYNTNSHDYAVTGRLTFLPWYEDDGRELLHLGFAARASSSVQDRTRFRTRDAIRSGVSVTWPVPADTGTIYAQHQQFLNSELVSVHGPWTFQSEYLVALIPEARQTSTGPDVGTLAYHGGYLQLLYFLTGESDHYNRKTATFERVTPHSNFSPSAKNGGHGMGAWQVGARYNYLDLNSDTINGGILNNLSWTLNWFLNPNMKAQFDYTATHRDAALPAGAGDGWIHGWGIRLAHDF